MKILTKFKCGNYRIDKISDIPEGHSVTSINMKPYGQECNNWAAQSCKGIPIGFKRGFMLFIEVEA